VTELAFSYEPGRDVLTIEGVEYSGELFRQLGIAPPGSWMRIVKRERVLTVFTVPDEIALAFDRFSGYPSADPP
jgi:hypothetical protein